LTECVGWRAPQPPNPSPIRRKTLDRPGTRVFFFVFGPALAGRSDKGIRLMVAHDKKIPMHHLGAALETQDQQNIGR
jgi:hypothetical protein